MTDTAEKIAVAMEVATLRQLAVHYDGGVAGIQAAFRQQALRHHPSVSGEPGRFRILVLARDALLREHP